jgi:hypothetical protein
VRTQLAVHRRLSLGHLRWVCEPVYKAHARENLPAAPPPELPLTCYDTGGEAPGAEVHLTDRNGFFDGDAKVGQPLMFCDPVTKQETPAGAPPPAPSPFATHLMGYALEAPPIPPATVFTRDALGLREVRFRRTVALLEPSTKNDLEAPLPEDLPLHCYAVEASEPSNGRLLLTDQFGRREVRLGSPALFCDPAVKRVR